MAQAALVAQALKADPTTWSNWELGHLILYRQHRARLARLPDLPIDALDQAMAVFWKRTQKQAR